MTHFFPSICNLGYKWVYEETGILHRDVSLDNLMFRHKDGKIIGVLNDFDLAIHKSEQNNGPLSKQQTGTKPFMAIDLLERPQGNPPLHRYRHDLESFMYVTLVLACFMLASDQVKASSQIADWFKPAATSSAIADSKFRLLSKKDLLPPVTETMTSLSPLVTNLYKCFARMVARVTLLNSEDQKPTDEETVDGVITMERFTSIFGA